MPHFMEIGLIIPVRCPVNSCTQWHDIPIIESGYAFSVNNTQQTLVILKNFGTFVYDSDECHCCDWLQYDAL